MSACKESVDPAVPGGHAVQFYEADDAVLVGNICRYVADGLTAGDHLLLVTTPGHQAAVLAAFEGAGMQVQNALADGQLRFLDADEMLERFMIDGYPDSDRFEEVIGETVRQARERSTGGMRAYGEMVGLLWQRGEYPAAIRLEQLWHRLLKTVDFSLFCAYPIDVFSDRFEVGLVDAILCAHTHLLSTAPNDELEDAVGRAMREVLEPNVSELRAGVRAHRALWPELPQGEASVLWLKTNVPERAAEILQRARSYYQMSRVAASTPLFVT